MRAHSKAFILLKNFLIIISYNRVNDVKSLSFTALRAEIADRPQFFLKNIEHLQRWAAILDFLVSDVWRGQIERVGGEEDRFETSPKVTLGIFETKMCTRCSKHWMSTI